MYSTLFWTSLLLNLCIYTGKSEFHVELVQVIMRHGERTPLDNEINLVNFKYNASSYEPWGLGQLFNLGKLTEYRVGTMLRQRYNDFLGPLYYPRDVYTLSTDYDRTKMSLQLVLAGLYPANSIQVWNPNLRWLAIPANYMPEKVNIVLNPDQCPAYQKALAKVNNMKEIIDKIMLYKDFFTFLCEKTGLNITKLSYFCTIYSLFSIQKNLNLTIPDWYTDDVIQNLQELCAMEYEVLSYTTELKRLNGGTLIRRFIDNMDIKGERNSSRKIYIYSGHDLNIGAFSKAHNISEPKLPDYGATFIFEKLRDQTGELYVRILFWTGVTEELITIKLADCEEICPLKTYLDLVQNVIPSDDEMNCLWNNITKEELLELYT